MKKQIYVGVPLLGIALTLLLSSAVVRGQEAATAAEMTPLEQVLTGASPVPNHAMTIYRLSVFDYFDLKEHNTDLKKEVFKKTPEYQALLDSLRSMKAQLQEGRWYIAVNARPPGGWVDEAWKIPNYDLKNGGFRLILGANMGMGTSQAKAPKSFGSFRFSSLPTRRVNSDHYPSDVTEERLFLPMSQENGLAVETGGRDIQVYVIFGISGQETFSFPYRCVTYGRYTVTQTLLTTKSIRIVVGNTRTGDVYFNRTY